DGTVYTIVNDSIWAVDSTGRKKWSQLVGFMTHSSPVILADHTVCAVAPFRSTIAWNETGEKVWSYYSDGYGSRFSPVVGADGSIYVFSKNTYFRALDVNAKLA